MVLAKDVFFDKILVVVAVVVMPMMVMPVSVVTVSNFNRCVV